MSIQVREDFDRIVVDGVVKGMEVASVARKGKTFYHTREEQETAVEKSVSDLYAIGGELPFLVSLGTANAFYRQRVVLEDLSTRRSAVGTAVIETDDWLALLDKPIDTIVKRIEDDSGPQYVLRLFGELKERRINSARAKKLILRYILGHSNIEFMSVKYRNLLRDALTHAWGRNLAYRIANACRRAAVTAMTDSDVEVLNKHVKPWLGELIPQQLAEVCVAYIFEMPVVVADNEYPIIEAVQRAHDDVYDNTELVPVEVLEGLVANSGHPQNHLWVGNKDVVRKKLREASKARTEEQKVRQVKSDHKIGVETPDINVEKLEDPILLLKAFYETGDLAPEVANRIGTLAEKYKFNTPYEKAIVLTDRSKSMLGHRSESKNLPRAHADFMSRVIEKTFGDANVYYSVTGGEGTNLVSPFLDALQAMPDADACFLFSDGYENIPYEGALSDALDAIYILTGVRFPVYHVTSIGSAEEGATARNLGGRITSISATHKTIGTQLEAEALRSGAYDYVRAWLIEKVRLFEDGR